MYTKGSSKGLIKATGYFKGFNEYLSQARHSATWLGWAPIYLFPGLSSSLAAARVWEGHLDSTEVLFPLANDTTQSFGLLLQHDLLLRLRMRRSVSRSRLFEPAPGDLVLALTTQTSNRKGSWVTGRGLSQKLECERWDVRSW